MSLAMSPLPKRMPRYAPVRDRVVYATRFTEYHCEDDVCVEVLDALSGEADPDHACLGMVAIAALDVSRSATMPVSSASQARPGQLLRFTPPTLDGPDVVTTELDSVEHRLLASHEALAAADRTHCGIAILYLTPNLTGSRVVYADRRLAQLNGVTVEQLRSDPLLLLAGSRPRPAHLRALVAVLQTRTMRPFLAVTRKTRPDGTFHDARMRLDLLHAEGDGTTRVVLVERGEGAERRDDAV